MRNGFLSTGYVPELGKVCSLMQLYQIHICYICTGYSSCDTLHRLGQISEFGTLRIHLILSVCLRASPEEQENKVILFSDPGSIKSLLPCLHLFNLLL